MIVGIAHDAQAGRSRAPRPTITERGAATAGVDQDSFSPVLMR